MTKQDRNIMFMAILTLALIVAAGVRVLFGAVAVAGDEKERLAVCGLRLADTEHRSPLAVSLGMAANVPEDVAREIRNWSRALSAKERAVFSEGWLALILRPVRSLDMASFLSPLSQAGVLLARLWRTARAQVWGWIQSVKKSLANLPSQKFSPSSSPFQGEGVRFFLPNASSLYRFCALRL